MNSITNLKLKIFSHISAYVAIILVMSVEAFAQMEVQPVEKQSGAGVASQVSARSKQTVLTLPFFDDFTVASGMYPDSSKWINSNSVWVNNTMGINPPTIRVATFDGLNSAGLPYSEDQLNVGYTDTLMSKPIDLSSADRDSTWLSFYFQWQGAGEAPDPTDYLELGIKDDAGTWRSILTIFPDTAFNRRVFYDTLVQIDSSIYFHDDFQFRFRSYGRESGPFDTWSIDYVFLNDNRKVEDPLSFPDRAAASVPTPLFGVYTSVPYTHFLEAEDVMDTVFIDAQNLKNQQLTSVDVEVSGTFTNYYEESIRTYSTVLMPQTGVRVTPTGDRNGIMGPLERVTTQFDTGWPDPENQDQFDSTANAVDIKLKFVFITGDEQDVDRNRFAPIDFRINDTISRTYRLDDYYAYDDGVAEYAANLITSGTYMAYQFENLRPSGDTLLGFDIYFPPYGVTSNQTVNFAVYGDNGGVPADKPLINLLKGVQRQDINEFMEVRFSPALNIPQGKFYVGWQQPLAGKAIVGLDADNDTGEKIFFSSDQKTWIQNQNVRGSLMIRPVFGEGEVDPIQVGIEDELLAKVYPNPNNGSFFIEGQFDEIAIFNAQGAQIPFQYLRDNLKSEVSLSQPGLFLVRITKGSRIETHKILVAR